MPLSVSTVVRASATLLAVAACSAAPAPAVRDSVTLPPGAKPTAAPALPAPVPAASPSPQSPASSAPPPAPVQSTYTRILAQNTSGYLEPTELVLRDHAALEAAWRILFAGNQGTPLPPVDFSRSTLVLLAMGERSTGGHGLRIDRVTREGDAAVVRYTVTRPGPGCMTTQVITAPTELISMPRVAGTVHFQKTEVVEAC
jgi:hypothetical protein